VILALGALSGATGSLLANGASAASCGGFESPCASDTSITHAGAKLVDLGLGAPVAGGSHFSAEVTLPAGTRRITVQARDAAGNLGAPAAIAVP